ncbi:MAG: hypothetical protein V3V31_02130 [Methylococcales bacterium]
MNKLKFLPVGFLLMANLHLTVNAAVVNNLVGDIDSFGTGVPADDPVRVVDIQHDDEDGSMDIWNQEVYTWNHNFIVPVNQVISSVSLTIVTFDVEDNGGGDGLGGAPFDTRLFVDGVEVASAFDDVFTPDGNANTFAPPNKSVFILDSEFFPLLADGSLSVLVDPSGGSLRDIIAIDYALLEITAVPIPASVWLLGSGVFSLIGVRIRPRKSAT